MSDPNVELSRMHVEAHRRALKELTREELEDFAIVEYGLTMYYSQMFGECLPDVGNLMYFGLDYEWLSKVTDEVINKTVLRAKEIAAEMAAGN